MPMKTNTHQETPMRKPRTFGLAAAALLAGCGSAPLSAITIAGAPLPSGDVISSAYVTTTTDGVAQGEGIIMVTSTSGMCNDLDAGAQPHGAQLLLITLADVSGDRSTAPVAPGRYVIGGSAERIGSLAYMVTDGNCQPAAESTAVSGAVELTSVRAGVYSGSFNATLDSGQTVSGSFSPSNCPELAAMVGSGQSLRCK
jgi:hypothetical protein